MSQLLKNFQSGLDASARNDLAGKSGVYLYGAGSTGRDVIRLLHDDGINVLAVLDAKSGLVNLEGVPVLRPDDARFSLQEKETVPVVITIFNSYVVMPGITSMLESLGWGNVIGFIQFHRTCAARMGNRFWLGSLDPYRESLPVWTEAANLWADDQSRTLYEDILNYRFTGNYDDAPVPDASDIQYCPASIPRWNNSLRFVDCGAYDGDTLDVLSKAGYVLEAVAAFEPDALNLHTLATRMPSLAPVANPAALWPCGVYSGTTQLRFESGKGSASAISASGDTMIQCVSIDDALHGFSPNFIKMDIEGAELAALLGARRTIHDCRPGLAICLYHHPAHLWQIPNLIRSWNLDYRFYLRVHSNNGFELVMYAVPN
jgi:FkbM family methyltransferase